MFAKRLVQARRWVLVIVIATLQMLFLPMLASRSLHASNRIPSSTASPSLITVNTTTDIVDGATTSFATLMDRPGPDGSISLREAIVAANGTPAGLVLTIAFNIPESDSGYQSNIWMIKLRPSRGALPTLTRGATVIDASTQPNGMVVLDGGDDSGVVQGLKLSSSGNIIRGLTIQHFYNNGIVLEGPASANQILNSVIQANGERGVVLRGSSVSNNRISGSVIQQNADTGIFISDGAHDTTIGGTTAGDRNYIRKNSYSGGIFITGRTTHDNLVIGNWIGLSDTGSEAAPNTYAGIRIADGAPGTRIGGDAPGEGNVISGNDSGVKLESTTGVTIAGNIVGLGPGGIEPLPNTSGGVFVIAGARNTTIGPRNIITGNRGHGVYIHGGGSDDNRVQGNYIGVDQRGEGVAAGNNGYGVLIGGTAQRNRIGGLEPGTENVIAANREGGVRADSSRNYIQGNLIGVTADGLTEAGNGKAGLWVGGEANVVGPDNVIANSAFLGVAVYGNATQVISNTIKGNIRSGVCVASNDVVVSGNRIWHNGDAAANTIDCEIAGGVVVAGGDDARVIANIISDNEGAGITVFAGDGNRLMQNSISNNQGGIQLASGGNDQIDAPVITDVSDSAIAGTGCSGCYVEAFADDGDQGRFFIGGTYVDENTGHFVLAITRADLSADHVSATLTDAAGNTSAFAKPFEVPLPISPRSNRVYLPLTHS